MRGLATKKKTHDSLSKKVSDHFFSVINWFIIGVWGLETLINFWNILISWNYIVFRKNWLYIVNHWLISYCISKIIIFMMTHCVSIHREGLKFKFWRFQSRLSVRVMQCYLANARQDVSVSSPNNEPFPEEHALSRNILNFVRSEKNKLLKFKECWIIYHFFRFNFYI